jgi:hypothetical protein
MNTRDAIAWFKATFHKRIATGVRNTPFTVDMLSAIAEQETGYIWAPLVEKGLSERDVLRLCVGDTLDADRGRRAFPKSKDELLAASRGTEMFAIARKALVDMARHTPGYAAAVRNPNKFCHGFGIFQYDLQFYKTNPDYFLQKKWEDFAACLAQCVKELKQAMGRQGWASKTTLTDNEKVYVAIAYNKGTAKLSLGFRQGHESDGKFYGENILEFLRIAQSIAVAGRVSIQRAPVLAPLRAPTPLEMTGTAYVVDVRESPLRLRSEPHIPRGDPRANVLARLPDGHFVYHLSGKNTEPFLEVETSLNGAYFRGFAASKFLCEVKKALPVDAIVPVPDVVEPTSGIVAVYMPRKAGTVTRRTAPAGAHSLNESGQPGRSGETAPERRAELAAIIDWLAVDQPSHERYQPVRGATFCNIYTHDYCFLAGVYLPRVWWMPGAIERLAQGETVEPLYETTIDEQRANDLFRWFRDFGLRFGWRQTSTLTKLQEAANLGGIGIIVARRKIDGKSGHIVAVVPETAAHKAKRDNDGNVIGALQSQAGSVNFRYRAGTVEWWKGEQFADSAFWIHA